MQIAVIGGGIAGLTAALALAKQGASVCVFEQAAALTEVGAGLQITPNAGRALRALGIWDQLKTVGIPAQAVVPTDGLSGRTVARFDLSGYDPSYLFVHRAALIDVLAQGCRDAGVALRLGTAMTSPPDGFDLIVGAEGLNSLTRARLNPESQPFFTGQVAWRAVVPVQADLVARIWMLPGRHVVTYPLRDGQLNVVAVQERQAWAEEGWSHRDDPAHLLTAFEDAAPDLRAILKKVDLLHLWGLFRHPVADRWHDDAHVLIGDAAHPTLPFLAQGANLAIEDAFVLAKCLKEGRTLAHYQGLRKPRVTRAIAAANANARNYHLGGVSRRIAHLGLRGLAMAAPGAFLRRMDWLYQHDVTV